MVEAPTNANALDAAPITAALDVAKERLIPPGYRLVGRFTLTGYPGVGKGDITRILAEGYGLTDNQVRRAGDIFFRKDRNVTAFQDRPIREDIYADAAQLDWLTDPDTNNVFGLETRAAAVLYRMEKDKLRKQHKRLPTDVPVVTILLTAPREVRLDRATNRDMKKNPGISEKQIRREVVRRQERDLVRLKKAHPEFENINPLSETSARFYDHVVGTTPSQEEIAYQIHQILEAEGVIERVQDHSMVNQATETPSPLRTTTQTMTEPASL